MPAIGGRHVPPKTGAEDQLRARNMASRRRWCWIYGARRRSYEGDIHV